MVVDVYAHAHVDDPKLRDQVVTEDYEDELARMEAEAFARPPAPPDDFDEVVCEDKF